MRLLHTATVGFFLLLAAGPAGASVLDAPLPVLPLTNTQSKLAFLVTGVIDDGASMATLIHCTNLDKVNGELAFEVFNFDGTQLNSAPVMTNGTNAFPAGSTVTISTSAVASVSEDEYITLSGTAQQGVGRILTTVKKIICTAQALDKNNTPPNSMVQLPVFRKGKQKGD